MDRNGYSESILQYSQSCYLCGRTGNLQRHEVFHGSNRQKSKRMVLWVLLCPECHYKVHNGDGSLDRKLKEEAQKKAGMTEDEFRAVFGKSYT